MTFDPEAYFADVKTWPPINERPKEPASPWKVYPAWTAAYDDEWGWPMCQTCGAFVRRDGTHACAACEGGR